MDFVFDEKNRELIRDGKANLLPLQEARVLGALLSSPGVTVSKQKLASLLWPEEQYGDFDRAINNIVSKLRRALGEGGRDSRCIQTVPKGGYRLFCTVRIETPEPDAPSPVHQPAAEEPLPLPVAISQRGVWLRWRVVFTACIVLLVGGALYLFHERFRRPRPVVVTTFGILPIEVSGKATPGTGEALRGELADAIAQVPNVQVRAAHSLTPEMAHNDVALRQAAHQFSLDMLLVGSLAMHENTYELNLELVRGSDGAHLRSFHFGGPDAGLPAAPAEIEKALFSLIVRPGSLSSSSQSAQGSTANLDAYGLYFQACQALAERTKPSVKSAIDLFKQAIQLDSQFAKAYSGLAESYLVLADFDSGPEVGNYFEEARTAANESIRLNPLDAQAHSVLGMLLLQHDWKLTEAETELRAAIHLNSGLAANHMRLAILLADRKDFTDAATEIELAHQLDPMWPVVYGTGLYVDIMGRRYASAIHDGQQLVAMRPDWSRAHQHYGWALWYSGKHAEAIQEWRQAAVLDNDAERQHLEDTGLKLLNEQGVRAYAHFKFTALGQHATDSDFVPAEWHAFAGDRVETLAALVSMVNHHDPESLKIPINPAYDFLRSDPQFAALLRRIATSVP